MSKTGPYAHALEPSFLNTEPQDEFIKEIADWIAFVAGGTYVCSHVPSSRPLFISSLRERILKRRLGRQNIEVEAKFGAVIDKSTGSRVAQRLGVLVETSERDVYMLYTTLI
jgi:hypothetical protein